MTRIEKEGGKAHCCVCEPHEGCTLGMKKNTPTATVVMERVNCKGVGDNDGFWKATITKNTPKDSFSDFVRSDSPEKAKVMDEILEKSIKRQNDSVKDTPKEAWEDRYDKEFFHEEPTDNYKGCAYSSDEQCDCQLSDIKAFIAKELELAKREGAREVREKMYFESESLFFNIFNLHTFPKLHGNYDDYISFKKEVIEQIKLWLATLREENVKS